MSRYFFHVVNGEFVPDLDGIDCADEEEVKAEAVQITGGMLKDHGLQLWKTKRFDMFVCDDQNLTRLKVSVAVEELREPGEE